MSEPMPDKVTGIILAGGRSRRLGRDKAVEPFGGQPLIRRVVERIEPVTDEIVVVVADPARGAALPLDARHRIVPDIYPDLGSLGGIFSGLTAAGGQWGLVVACDMPFLNRQLLEYMRSRREGFDAVVPLPGAYPEPAHALYSKACLPHIEARLRAGDLKISRFFDAVRVNYLTGATLTRFDPELRSFFNVNSPEDLAQALALDASPGGPAPLPEGPAEQNPRSPGERAGASAAAPAGAATAAINIKVELFGTPRLVSGRREVELTLPPGPPGAARHRLVRALAEACPALVGHGLRPDLADLEEGYIFNRNGVAFLGRGDFLLQEGDSLLLVSSQAGG